MKTLKKREINIKAYPVSVQILAGIFLAVVIYFAAVLLSNLVVAALRPIFQYGYPDSLFITIVLYLPILSDIAASIFAFYRNQYWLGVGLIVGIFVAVIILLECLAGL